MKRITFTIGTEKRWNGKSIFRDAAETWKRQACLSVAKVYGGYTATEAKGGWVNGAGELVEETTLVITAVNPAGLPDDTAVTLAEHLRDLFGQEAVLLTIEELREGMFV